MKATKRTAARMYLDCMAESITPPKERTRKAAKPVHLDGGCLLYKLPQSNRYGALATFRELSANPPRTHRKPTRLNQRELA